MKILFLTGMLAVATGAVAQDTSGVIEYEMMSRMEMTMLSVSGGGSFSAGGDGGGDPMVMTTKQKFTFSGSKAKIESDFGMGGMGGNAMVMPMMAVSGRAMGSGTPPPPPPSAMKGMSFSMPMTSATYMDLANKKYLTVMNERKDSTITNTWFTEEDYNTTGTFKLSSKTKTIAGYNCHRATAKLGDEVFTVWYTTDLPFSYSPINGVLPEKGVILSIESSRRSYVAKKIEMKPVAGADVSLPANAQKITSEELKEKRRQIMERFQQEQFRKFQQAQ